MTEVSNSDNFRTYRLIASDSGEIEDPKTRNLTTAIAQQVLTLLDINIKEIKGPGGKLLGLLDTDESTTIEGAIENVIKRDVGRLAVYLTVDGATEKPIMAVAIGQETPADRYPKMKNDILRRLRYRLMARSQNPELRIFGFGSEILDKEVEQEKLEQIIDDQINRAKSQKIYPERVNVTTTQDGGHKNKPRRRISARLSNMGRFYDAFLKRYSKQPPETE